MRFLIRMIARRRRERAAGVIGAPGASPSGTSSASATPSWASSAADSSATRHEPSSAQSALLVARREITVQMRNRATLVSLIIILVAILGGIILGSVLSKHSSSPSSAATATLQVAVVPATAADAAGLPGVTAVPVADEAAARAAVQNGTVAAALLPDSGPAGVRVVARNGAPGSLVTELTRTPVVEVLNPATASDTVRYLVSFGFGIVFMMVSMIFGSTIAQNTIIEKQTRVVEVLLAAVSARVLMAGKVIGNTVLALVQTAAMALVAVIGLKVTGQEQLLSLISGPIGWFVVFFVFGFVLLAAMFAAAGSLVSRVEDSQAVLMPVMLLVMIPYFLVIFAGDNMVLLRVMSYVPFAAPVGMPLRIYLGDAAGWEPYASLVLLAACAVGVVWLAALVYRRSVLRMGARVRLGEVLGRRATV
ncbi:MAG: ABC transporter permease [Micrococcales bacterium]|nr:ABC transporter permease [Micrococcales bacterium]